jgi:GT2 family glycosyltransferase
VFTWMGGGPRRGHGARDLGQYDVPEEIFGACGGAVVYRRRVFEEVGGFDEAFFTFYEDIDWDFRAQLAGYRCRYVPSAVAYHMASATIGSGLTDFTRYQLWRNTIWVIAKNAPSATIIRHLPALCLGQARNFAVAVRDGTVGVFLQAWRDALSDPRALLRKRRTIQASRRVDNRGVEMLVARRNRP